MQKKFLVFSFPIISFFIALFAFSSCSKKEKDPTPDAKKPALIGVWDIEKMHAIRYQNGNEVYNETTPFNAGDGTYEFRENGFFIITGTKVDNGQFTYEHISGINKIRIMGDNESGTFDIKELTDKKLQLYMEVSDDDGEGNVTIYLNKR